MTLLNQLSHNNIPFLVFNHDYPCLCPGDVLYETAKAGKSFKGVQIRPSDRSWFTVDASVRTCEQAEIGLFTFEADETSSLTVVYGSDGNTMSEIIKGDQAVDMAVTPYLMNEKV